MRNKMGDIRSRAWF